MEFHEKLQQLRKKQNMTQEQLAEHLYVSRTAVSKWESGRGYPNLESLKSLSKLFSVSIDELLSNEELIELAETANRANIKRVSGLVFGVLDLITIVFLFMPFFGQDDGTLIRSVTLFSYTGVSDLLHLFYVLSLVLICVFGVFEVVVELTRGEMEHRFLKPCSIALYAVAILLFAFSRQPYITVFLFLLFMVKVVLIMQENIIK